MKKKEIPGSDFQNTKQAGSEKKHSLIYHNWNTKHIE
jgi:hypothetical protein